MCRTITKASSGSPSTDNYNKIWKLHSSYQLRVQQLQFWQINLYSINKKNALEQKPEAIHVTFHFLTYWLAKNNFCAINNHIALSCKINEWNYVARECNMVFYCREIAFCEIFETFWKFYHFEFFWNSMKFLKVLKFYENFEFLKKKMKFSNLLKKKFIRLYFTVFLLARSNTRDIPFSNILISKKQFLCNK
jgi:hypothetical protein